MTRALLLLAALGACSRPTPAPAPSNPTAQVAQRDAFQRASELHRQQRQVMRRANLSPFPSTEEGARAFALDLAQAAAANDVERLRARLDELRVDDARLELALTFDGARALRDRVIPRIAADANALVARLAALRGPLDAQVTSALANELAQGRGIALTDTTRAMRPLVRVYRVELRGSDGAGAAVIEPLAWLGGRWTWLGESAASPTTPSTPTTPSARSGS